MYRIELKDKKKTKMNQYEKIHNELMFENHKGRVYTLLSKYDEMTLKQLNRFYEKKTTKIIEQWKRNILIKFISYN